MMGIAALNPSYASPRLSRHSCARARSPYSAGRIRGKPRAGLMQAADIIAIVLVLGAVIGCLNSLYFRLPPAIGVCLDRSSSRR